MSGQSNAAPVIIKRKKIIAAGGHHGGAWKVAMHRFLWSWTLLRPCFPAPHRDGSDVVLTNAARGCPRFGAIRCGCPPSMPSGLLTRP